MARVSSPARQHRPQLPRLTPAAGCGRRMNPLWILRTARLVLTPVGGADLADLRAIKADPRVFAIMLGGVRSPSRRRRNWPTMSSAWGANGFGIWAIREAGRLSRHHRPRAAAGRPRRRATLRAMAGGAGPRPRPRGRRRGAALRSRSGRSAAHHRGGAGEQFRLAHGARRHRHDGVRRLHPAGYTW